MVKYDMAGIVWYPLRYLTNSYKAITYKPIYTRSLRLYIHLCYIVDRFYLSFLFEVLSLNKTASVTILIGP